MVRWSGNFKVWCTISSRSKSSFVSAFQQGGVKQYLRMVGVVALWLCFELQMEGRVGHKLVPLEWLSVENCQFQVVQVQYVMLGRHNSCIKYYSWVTISPNSCSGLTYFELIRLRLTEVLIIGQSSKTCTHCCFCHPCACYCTLLMSLVVFAGKCIPITRGAGIYQPHMAEALDRINEGDWVNLCFIYILLAFHWHEMVWTRKCCSVSVHFFKNLRALDV